MLFLYGPLGATSVWLVFRDFSPDAPSVNHPVSKSVPFVRSLLLTKSEPLRAQPSSLPPSPLLFPSAQPSIILYLRSSAFIRV